MHCPTGFGEEGPTNPRTPLLARTFLPLLFVTCVCLQRCISLTRWDLWEPNSTPPSRSCAQPPEPEVGGWFKVAMPSARLSLRAGGHADQAERHAREPEETFFSVPLLWQREGRKKLGRLVVV